MFDHCLHLKNIIKRPFLKKNIKNCMLNNGFKAGEEKMSMAPNVLTVLFKVFFYSSPDSSLETYKLQV